MLTTKELVTYLDKIPLDVLYLILLSLDLESLVAISAVSKYFYNASQQNILWKPFLSPIEKNHRDGNYKEIVKNRYVKGIKGYLDEYEDEAGETFINALKVKFRLKSKVNEDLLPSFQNIQGFFHKTTEAKIHFLNVQLEFVAIAKTIFTELKKFSVNQVSLHADSACDVEKTNYSNIFQKYIWASTGMIQTLLPYLKLFLKYVQSTNDVTNIQKLFDYMNENIQVNEHTKTPDLFSLSIDQSLRKIAVELKDTNTLLELDRIKEQVEEFMQNNTSGIRKSGLKN